MTYTTNYHLPQWVKEDRIMMDDFNQMCANIEAGLDKTAADAADATARAAAAAAADTAKAAASAAKAQSTADKAVQDAAAAQATANAAYCPTNLPYIAGSYTGTREELTVTVGFQPRFLLICLPADTDTYMHFYASGIGINSDRVKFTSTGFKVYADASDGHGSTAAPALNYLGRQYVYIAFR